MIFTCLNSAFEEAQFLANEMRECGQRRSAYIAQRYDCWNVSATKPKGAVSMTVKPERVRILQKPKTGQRVYRDGIYYEIGRQRDKRWRARPSIGGELVSLGYHLTEKDARTAITKYKESFNA